MPSILFLDLATDTGWALADSKAQPFPSRIEYSAGTPVPKIMSGNWNFKNQKAMGAKMDFSNAYKNLEERIVDLNTAFDIVELCYEAPLPPAAQRSYVTGMFLIGMAETTAAIAAKIKAKPIPIHNGTIKSFATGTGRSKKPDMLEAAKNLGHPFTNDNECDAFFGLGLRLSQRWAYFNKS